MPTKLTFLPLPENRDDVLQLRASMLMETVEGPDGALRWKSNGAVLSPGTFQDAYIVCSSEQRKVYEVYVLRVIEEYRCSQVERCPSSARMDDAMAAERAFEMTAAFGPGVDIVNVLTGQRYRT